MVKNLVFLTLFIIVFITGCAPKVEVDEEPFRPPDGDIVAFMKVHSLGKSVSSQASFDEFLGHLPDNKAKSRIYLARVDEFSLGAGYQMLDKWDMAIESGLIDGFIEKGMTITEKLDHVSPRDPSEYVGNSPMDAFYMLSLIHI